MTFRVAALAACIAGGKLIVVDAIDSNAAAFYRHYDFEPPPNRPDRFVMKLSTAARALGIDWPKVGVSDESGYRRLL